MPNNGDDLVNPFAGGEHEADTAPPGAVTTAIDEDYGVDITVDGGTVRGYPIQHYPRTRTDHRPPIHRWKAVPYRSAADPHAEFLPPQPVEEFREILHCGPERPGGAATLSICAETTDGFAEAKRPVIVFIHGGRFETGHADGPWYHGETSARDGAVFVSVNYRKRFQGFLPLDGEPLPADFPRNPAGEPDFPYYRGAEDILAALRWIHRNIARFGGDPNNVTAIGQSAGGAMITWALCDPRTEGLIHRCVILSMGFPRVGWPARARAAERCLGVPREFLAVADLTTPQVEAAYRKFARRFSDDCALGMYPFVPERIRAVPMLIGTMQDEFLAMPIVKTLDGLAEHKNWVIRTVARFTIRQASKTLGIPGYPIVPRPFPPTELSRAQRSAWLKRWMSYAESFTPARIFGRAVSESAIRRWNIHALEAQADQGETWAYEFYAGETNPIAVAQGAQHCADLPLAFDCLDRVPTAIEKFCGAQAAHRLQPLADRFHQIIIDFASGRSPDWPEYEPQHRIVNRFNMSTCEERLSPDHYGPIRQLFPALYSRKA